MTISCAFISSVGARERALSQCPQNYSSSKCLPGCSVQGSVFVIRIYSSLPRCRRLAIRDTNMTESSTCPQPTVLHQGRAKIFTVAAWEGHGSNRRSRCRLRIIHFFPFFGIRVSDRMCGKSAQGLWPFARRVDPCRRTRALVVKFPCCTYRYSRRGKQGPEQLPQYVRKSRIAPWGIVWHLCLESTSRVTFHKLTSLS